MDNETREVLITICETLKAEFRYLASLQRALAELRGALMAEFPGVEMRRGSQLIEIREHPPTVEQIELIDELLARLKKL